jgi:integrase
MSWCWAKGEECLPASPLTVSKHLASLVQTGKSASTLRSRIAAIGYAHKMAGETNPCTASLVQAALQGGVRTVGEDVTRAAPFTLELLREACARMFDPNSFKGRRDRALLLLGWAAALRRSEIVALQASDVRLVGTGEPRVNSSETDSERLDGGLLVTIRKSKTDQTAKTQSLFVPYASSTLICPVRATRWLLSDIPSGSLFRSCDRHGNRNSSITPGFVNLTVKRAARLVNRDDSRFSGHSLRAGFVTSMRAKGIPEYLIARQTRHSDLRMLAVYDRPEDLTLPGASALSGADWW